MLKKISFIAAVIAAFTFASAPRSSAGTEMIDNSGAPAPNYSYTPAPPPPPPVYYAPPPVSYVVYPALYRPPVAVYGYYASGRVYARRPYCRPRHWR